MMSDRVYIEAYDADGNVIAWSGIPAEMKEKYSDWEMCEIYKRQVGADSCKVF